MADGLTSEPLVVRGGFNWIFLIEILVSGILALFFLFYFNRLFATIVSYCIRAWTWHKYKAYIDIQALQISLLGGRVFFKSIRYHAHNVTCIVHEGHITWRYWLRLVQNAEAFQVEHVGRTAKSQSEDEQSSEDHEKSSTEEKADKEARARSRSIGKEESAGGVPKKILPCHISVKVSGVEAFVYNRSPLYDLVLDQTLAKANEAREVRTDDGSEASYGPESKATARNALRRDLDGKLDHSDTLGSSIAQDSRGDWVKPELPGFLRLFPVKIECRRAAATLGNENTTNVVVAAVDRAVGTIDAGHAGPFDLYKLIFQFDLGKINATMKPNRDFKQLQLDAARRLMHVRGTAPGSSKSIYARYLDAIHSQWQRFVAFLFYSRDNTGSIRTSSLKSEKNGIDYDHSNDHKTQWHGLDRYVDEGDLDEHDEWKDVEYAKASTLADIERMHFKFFFDIPGKVTNAISDHASEPTSAYHDDMNGAKPPDYGMEFAVYGGVVTYGPWADRQRLNLQQIFFPAAYVDSSATPRLRAGEIRSWSLFKIFITIEEELTLRIPSRELSKDEKWQGRYKRADTFEERGNEQLKHRGKHGRKYKHARRRKGKGTNSGIDARPYGWLDVIVKADTTVTYTMDMFPGASGYKNSLDIDCKATEITSSVNHGLLWRTGPVSVLADLSQPSTWRSLRKWPFDIVINDMELFILRDHLFLIIDLVNDWSYGPPVDFYTFVPYVYSLRMLFRNFCIYLNANDANIINQPANLDRNDFCTLEGTLDATLDINMDQYRPIRNMIRFDVLMTEARMRMLSPSRSTFSVLLEDKVVATLPKLTLSGSFSGHLEERPGLVDTLRFDIVGSGLTLKAYGYLIRHLINIKENYFGDYMHFRTLEEFQEADDDLNVANVKTASIPKPKFINELDVMLCIVADDVTVLVPSNIYSCDKSVRIECPLANLDLRIISYYLDMGLQLAPVTILSGGPSGGEVSPTDASSKVQMFVKHLNLDGHRSFGLPPDEPPYISQWDIDVGAISGELSSTFIHDLALGARAFVFGFQDCENIMPLLPPSEFFDPGFVQVRTDTVRLWLRVGKDGLLFSAEPIEVTTNDWAGNNFSQRVNVVVPRITLACVDAKSAPRQLTSGTRRTPVKTYAFFQTGASINVLIRKPHFEEERRKQQDSIRENDRRTRRAPFLLRPAHSAAQATDDHDFYPPTMPYPFLPPPLGRDGQPRERPSSIRSASSFVNGKAIKSKSSFRSLSSSIRQDARATEAIVMNSTSERRSRERAYAPSGRSNSPASSLASSSGHKQLAPNVTFSSTYAQPYFPLDMIEPDETNIPAFDIPSSDGSADQDPSSSSDELSNPDLNGDAAQTSIMIQLIPGIRAYAEPRVAVTGSKLLRKLLPRTPEEVMDTFQMDTLGAVIAKRTGEAKSNEQTLEIQIGIPTACVRVVNPGTTQENNDQVDLKIESAETFVRARDIGSSSGMKQVLAVHAKARGIIASLGRAKSLSTLGPAMSAKIDEALVWVAVAAAQSVHATIESTILSVSGEQAEGLLDFVLQLLPVIGELHSKFSTVMQLNQGRLRMLMQSLTERKDDIGDPAFLSGFTYVLRAFPDHFRNQESWKLIARLRHALQHMPSKTSQDLKSSMKIAELKCTSGQLAKQLNEWAEYRNWDIPNPHATIAFQKLFETEGQQDMAPKIAIPLVLTIESNHFRVAVEAASEANELVLEEMSLGMENTPPTAPTGLMLVSENLRTKTLIQIHASSIAFSAHWSIFGIVERILPLTAKLKQFPGLPVSPDQPTATERFEESLYRHIYQVVASTDDGSITLQSINLRHLSRAEGLKLSLIGTTQAVEDGYGPCATAIINADLAITELHGLERPVWRTVLTSPSLYMDHLRPAQGMTMPPSTYVAVNYRTLKLSLIDQLPGVLHLVDSVIIDEAAKIMQLVKQAGKDPSLIAEVPHEISSGPPVKLHVALLAGDLHLEASLLQTLSYELAGRAASIRVAPTFSKDKAWAIDFDVGSQSHRFVNSSTQERHAETIVDVPPINGCVGLELAEDATHLSVATTLQRIEINAAALQEVATTINKPEVQDVISAIKSGINDVEDHVKDLVPTSPTKISSPADGAKHLIFDVRFAILGVRVATAAPRASRTSLAAIELGFGQLHAIASNKQSSPDGKSRLPDVRAQVRDIGARLQIDDRARLQPCGDVSFGVDLHFQSRAEENGKIGRSLNMQSRSLIVNVLPDTPVIAAEVMNHVQHKLRSLDLSRDVEYLRHLSNARRHQVIKRISGKQVSTDDGEVAFSAEDLLAISTTVQLDQLKVAWIVDDRYASTQGRRTADLVLTLAHIEFTTRGGHEARLAIQDLQVQLVEKGAMPTRGAINSALLPQITFTVGYWLVDHRHSLCFRAAGTPLEIRLEPRFVFPVDALQRSMLSSMERFKAGTAEWKYQQRSSKAAEATSKAELLDAMRLASLLVEAEFAGAEVYLEGSNLPEQNLTTLSGSTHQTGSQHGRYGQFAAEGEKVQMSLQAPGIALKLEYNARTDKQQPLLNGEVRVDASKNLLQPSVVPLVREISRCVQEVLKNQEPAAAVKRPSTPPEKQEPRFFEDDALVNTTPTAIFGKTKVDLGLRICRQEFGLTCQPRARVDAKAELDDLYITMNTIDADQHGHFFAVTAVVTKLSGQVKHTYSREPNLSLDMESIVLSVMNNKHLSGTTGISAILKIEPSRAFVNGKQLEDLLLFRDIWVPAEIRSSSVSPQTAPDGPDEFFAQKYRDMAAAAAFPWNATVSIAQLAVDVDLGQSIGRSSLKMTNLWASQAKSSNFQQNLCIGLDEVEMNSTGRMSGFIRLSKLGVRTSIEWAEIADRLARSKTPLIQASVGFQRLVAKAAFDYQVFAFADVEGFDFLMYNVHQAHGMASDRLVAALDCDKAYVFCTSTSPARAVGLYQAFDRFIQDKQNAFIQSLKDIEPHLRRESTIVPTRYGPTIPDLPVKAKTRTKSSISLHTDVVVTIGTVSFGVFPNTFFDAHILKLEANNIQARFAVGLERGRIASALGMTLGQLQVALAGVKRMTAVPKALDVSVDEVVSSAVNAKGGTILRVPRVVASMQTWQAPDAHSVDYIFKSLFDGKIDVGWNLSRIDFIQGMWTTHARSLANRLGKPLPKSAVKITAGPMDDDGQGVDKAKEKITAEVNLPQSKYDYHALQTPIIETPQLRDLGEATPSLEWIGLNKDRMPNVTHEIIIVSLLGIAKKVEDAYQSILGSS